ncbi:MAG: hypothetical protein IJ574_01020 [Bacilli bacterium]|nr:hypothetical protein [Bacilli bacterium]
MINNPRYLKEIYDRNIDRILLLCSNHAINNNDVKQIVYDMFYTFVKEDLVFKSLDEEKKYIKSTTLKKLKKYKLTSDKQVYDKEFIKDMWQNIINSVYSNIDNSNKVFKIVKALLLVVMISIICIGLPYLAAKILSKKENADNSLMNINETKEQKEYEIINTSLVDDIVIVKMNNPSEITFNDAILNYNIKPVYLSEIISSNLNNILIFKNVEGNNKYNLKVYANDFNIVKTYNLDIANDNRDIIVEQSSLNENLIIDKLTILNNYIYIKGTIININSIKIVLNDGSEVILDNNKYLSTYNELQMIYYSSSNEFNANDINKIIIDDVYELSD